MARFTLEPRKWYAAEIFGEEFGGDIRVFSPIRVDGVKPKGGRKFTLAFYHAIYPEGVREKIYELETIERNKNFLIAQSTDHKPRRILLVYAVTASWLAGRLGIKVSEIDNVQDWLNKNA